MNTLVTRKPLSLLDEFFADATRAGDRSGTGSFEIAVEKRDADYRVVANLPGVKKEDLTIEIKDGVLAITGKVEREAATEYKTVYSELSGRSEFQRRIKIDQSRFDTEKVSAKIENGVLEVVLPVKPEEQPKQIQVH